jgi:hypothetical protein
MAGLEIECAGYGCLGTWPRPAYGRDLIEAPRRQALRPQPSRNEEQHD